MCNSPGAIFHGVNPHSSPPALVGYHSCPPSRVWSPLAILNSLRINWIVLRSSISRTRPRVREDQKIARRTRETLKRFPKRFNPRDAEIVLHRAKKPGLLYGSFEVEIAPVTPSGEHYSAFSRPCQKRRSRASLRYTRPVTRFIVFRSSYCSSSLSFFSLT